MNLIRPLTEVPGLNLITVPLREVIDAFHQKPTGPTPVGFSLEEKARWVYNYNP